MRLVDVLVLTELKKEWIQEQENTNGTTTAMIPSSVLPEAFTNEASSVPNDKILMKPYLYQCQKEYFYIIDKLAFMSLDQEECNRNEHHLWHVLNKSKEFSTHYLDCIDYVFSCKNARTEKKSLTDYPRKLLKKFWPVKVAYLQFYELYFAFCLLLFLNPKHSNAIEDKLIDCRKSVTFIHTR